MGPRGTAALPVDAFVREIKDREVGALADSVGGTGEAAARSTLRRLEAYFDLGKVPQGVAPKASSSGAKSDQGKAVPRSRL